MLRQFNGFLSLSLSLSIAVCTKLIFLVHETIITGWLLATVAIVRLLQVFNYVNDLLSTRVGRSTFN